MASPKYAISEKVLVPHVDRQYEAKVLKAEHRQDGIWYYYLHYHGWNKKWDEWVEEPGLRRSCEVTASGSVSSVRRNNGKVNGHSNGNGHGESMLKSKKRKADELSDTSLQVNIDIPPILKKQLLDEYTAIIVQNKTLSLPRQPTAMEVVKRFVEYGTMHRWPVSELRELATGLEEYLDKMLQSRLLYKVEREDAEKFLVEGTCASAVYGAEHLLRLLIKLPEIVPSMPTTLQQATTLRARLQDFAMFLMAHRHLFFAKISEYRPRPYLQVSPPPADGVLSGSTLIHTPPAAIKMEASLWSMPRMETS